MIELAADDVHANYAAQLEALAGRTADGSLGHEISAPTHKARHTFISFVPKTRIPWRRRIWRAIQKRIPW